MAIPRARELTAQIHSINLPAAAYHGAGREDRDRGRLRPLRHRKKTNATTPTCLRACLPCPAQAGGTHRQASSGHWLSRSMPRAWAKTSAERGKKSLRVLCEVNDDNPETKTRCDPGKTYLPAPCPRRGRQASSRPAAATSLPAQWLTRQAGLPAPRRLVYNSPHVHCVCIAMQGRQLLHWSNR